MWTTRRDGRPPLEFETRPHLKNLYVAKTETQAGNTAKNDPSCKDRGRDRGQRRSEGGQKRGQTINGFTPVPYGIIELWRNPKPARTRDENQERKLEH